MPRGGPLTCMSMHFAHGNQIGGATPGIWIKGVRDERDGFTGPAHGKMTRCKCRILPGARLCEGKKGRKPGWRDRIAIFPWEEDWK